MSAIHQALSKLEHVVGKLEHSMNGFEEALVGQQRDMFGEPAPSNENAQGSGVSRAEVAQRLDNAIEKVEQLMAEGA